MIQINNVTFSYSKYYKLFNQLSLELAPGNIYGLLGKNGTGKTTLIKLMTGLLLPHEGQCKVFNMNAGKRLPSVLANYFIVPEEFTFPSIKMNDYVRINSPFYPKFSASEYAMYLKDFELEENKNLNALSYGQKKKFLLAFGLATNVKLLFLDEPTNGLDIPSKSQFRKTVARSLNEEKSIIISTHQARDLESLIDSVIILESGKIILNSPCSLVTQKLAFGKVKNLDETTGFIYQEDTLGGYKIVAKSNGKDESELDLELFFNAVISNVEDVAVLFNN
jgi:ABC-2 type transport system ATP-binding protein